AVAGEKLWLLPHLLKMLLTPTP
uniref:Polydim-I n=1 Tax=Polybia dimorpha TaxID=2893826 RepID=PLD_POLDI|nr:RecName: Full=Polydim-I [Polybia dimorpha]